MSTADGGLLSECHTPSLFLGTVTAPTTTTPHHRVSVEELLAGDWPADAWPVDPPAADILVHRAVPGTSAVDDAMVAGAGDVITTPLLDGFELPVDDLFAGSG